MTAFMDAVGVEVGWRKKNSGQRESNPPFDVQGGRTHTSSLINVIEVNKVHEISGLFLVVFRNGESSKDQKEQVLPVLVLRSSRRQWRLISTRTADKSTAHATCLRFEALAKSTAQQVSKVGPTDAAELTEAGLKLIQHATKGELTEDNAREFVNPVLKASGQGVVDGQTVSEFLDARLAGKKLARSENTAQKYRTTVKIFKKSLGKKADRSLSTVTPKDIERFRDARLKDVGASIVAADQKILHMAFKAATRQGLVQRNVAEAVDLPKSESKSRDAFTVEEVDLLVKTTDEREWKTAILLGFDASLRLGDAVALEWKSVDLEGQMLRYRVAKTGRIEEVPINRKLLRHLKSIKGSRKGSICPALPCTRKKSRGAAVSVANSSRS